MSNVHALPNSQTPVGVVPIVCLPYAGGSANAFHSWTFDPVDRLIVRPVELPGRGARFSETPHRSFKTLIPALAAELHQDMNGPFALFGHSMGALIAFELCRHFRRCGKRLPIHLFVSGCRAPQCQHPNSDGAWYRAPLPIFLDRLRKLNGTPAAVLENRELLQAMLPFLRADFRMVHQYHYVPEPRLSLPITAFGGRNDSQVPVTDLRAWEQQTSVQLRSYVFPGDHFFLREQKASVVEQILESSRSFTHEDVPV